MTTLEERAAAIRARMRVRAWEARQVRTSKGTWYRLRSTLARAREAYSVDDRLLAELLSEGYVREPVGDELEPARNYVFVPADRAAKLSQCRPLQVRLSAELLAATNVLLVPFG